MKISKAEARGTRAAGGGPKTAVRESAGERSPGEAPYAAASRPPGRLTTTREVPILFSAPMVRAIIAGTKTQTRRLVTWQGPKGHPHYFDRAFTDRPAGPRRLCVPHHHPEDKDAGRDNPCHRHYPRWQVGDRLWAKETWACSKNFDYIPIKGILSDSDTIWYRASTGEYPEGMEAAHGRWRPSIFMQRFASRLTLEVTAEPEPQRLQDISDIDVVAEGLDLINGDRRKQDAYAELWDSLNAKRAPWASNPWVWRIEFRRLP